MPHGTLGTMGMTGKQKRRRHHPDTKSCPPIMPTPSDPNDDTRDFFESTHQDPSPIFVSPYDTDIRHVADMLVRPLKGVDNARF